MAQRILAAPTVNALTGSQERAETAIYKPFFLAGMISVLTAGCTLGAIALLGISQARNYLQSAWTPYVLAHANSQVYGWVGMFVMGFALQQHAPRVERLSLFNALAWTSLLLISIGIGLRFAAEPMVASQRSPWLAIGIGSCCLQAIAVLLFMANIGLTRHRTGEGLTWQTGLVFSSLAWWMAAAISEPLFFAGSHQADSEAATAFIARWSVLYRDAQFLGFVTMMIFGVALVKMHTCFGAKHALTRIGIPSFILWNVAMLARFGGWLKYSSSGFSPDAVTWYAIGSVGLVIAAVGLVNSSRLFEPLSGRLPSHKLIRSAMVWFLIGCTMVALEPLYWRSHGVPFSHAYTGAVRHALTVGFISQMILGVGLHVVASMNDVPRASIPKVWPTFLLLNIGNALRVFSELLTDSSPRAFGPMGISGMLELLGIALWVVAMGRMMFRKRLTTHA